MESVRVTPKRPKVRWIARDEWCNADLTNDGPDLVGERCKLPKDHLLAHSPIFGWPSHGNDNVFAEVRVEPVEALWDPERIEFITFAMERDLLLEMWRVGYSPVCPPYWEMWVEDHRYSLHGDWLAGDYSTAHFKVMMLGVPVRREK